jgi:hypothetical protein
MGLVVRIYNDQAPNEGGRIVGPFELVHWGTGTYAAEIQVVWHRQQTIFPSVVVFIDRLTSVSPESEFTHGLNANGLWLLDAETVASEIIKPAL